MRLAVIICYTVTLLVALIIEAEVEEEEEGRRSDELAKSLSSTSCFTCANSSLLVPLVCVTTPSVVIGWEFSVVI